MNKNRFSLNVALGISAEVLYTLAIILAAFLACLIFSLKI
jgi:hypothetical protein